MRSFDLSSAPAGTAVACHDAGAANIVIAGMRASGRNDWRACMRGPALKIWRSAFPDAAPLATLEQAISGAPFLISGTGWASDFEHEARSVARSLGVPAAGVLDHWVNYEARFVRAGVTVWPNEFWVTDRDAWEIAVRTFPVDDVVMCRNRYVEGQLAAMTRVEKSAPPELLYVLEPMRDDWGRGTPGEFQALDYFAGHLSDLDLPADTTIRLRLHPSEEWGKYDSWIAAHPNLEVTIDQNHEIANSLGRSSWVAGCESFAMALAVWAGLKVYCTLPPWAPPCHLPQRELIHLTRLVTT